MTSRRQFLAASTASAALAGCATLRADCDLLIRNGTLYDGSGGAPFTGDVAVRGKLRREFAAHAREQVDHATGQVRSRKDLGKRPDDRRARTTQERNDAIAR